MPGRHHPSEAVLPRHLGVADQLVHTREVDGDALERLVGGPERGLRSDQRAEVGAPVLDADRFVATPVDDRRRHRRRRQHRRDQGGDVVVVDRVVDAGCVDVDGDRHAPEHRVDVGGGPAAVVAVGHVQAGDGGREAELAGEGARHRLGGDLGDAVGLEERPDPMVVAQRVGFGEGAVAVGLVHGRRGAVQEGPGAGAVMHERPGATGVAVEVPLPVVGLHDREVEDIGEVVRQPAQVAVDQVDGDAGDPRRLQPAAGGGVGEPGRRPDVVVRCQRQRQRQRDLPRRTGDQDPLPLQHVREATIKRMFDGYRILELGTWVFVPAAATVLADFGADVVKVEHPLRGDPQRGLSTGGVTPNLDGVSIAMEQTNRGKRSVGLDVAVPEGRELLYELAARSDVFMTSFLPAARQKMQIDVDHIRAHNPDIIYVRADAVGPKGPESGKPGYDSAVLFGRGCLLDSLHPDRQQRRNTNPIAGTYATADGRWISLTMLESDRWWPELCRHLDREDLLSDPRFADAPARTDNGAACAEELARTFASAPLEEWRRRLATLRAPWEVVQNQLEVLDDPQARDNGYLTEVDHPTGRRITVVRAPVQFDETPPPLGTAPEPGAHTEEVLLELGHDWDDIVRYKEQGAIP